MPAKDGLIAYTLVPIGGFEFFMGFTPEALGFPRNHTVLGPPATRRSNTRKTDLNLPPPRSPRIQISTSVVLPD